MLMHAHTPEQTLRWSQDLGWSWPLAIALTMFQWWGRAPNQRWPLAFDSLRLSGLWVRSRAGFVLINGTDSEWRSILNQHPLCILCETPLRSFQRADMFWTACWGQCGKIRRASEPGSGWGTPGQESPLCGPRGSDLLAPPGAGEAQISPSFSFSFIIQDFLWGSHGL